MGWVRDLLCVKGDEILEVERQRMQSMLAVSVVSMSGYSHTVTHDGVPNQVTPMVLKEIVIVFVAINSASKLAEAFQISLTPSM